MAKKLTQEERQKLRETEEKKRKNKKIIYIVAFVVALILGIVFTVSSIMNLYKLGEFEDDPLPELPTKNEELPVDDFIDGKLIVYNPRTDISIIRHSIVLPHQATATIKYRDEKLEQPQTNTNINVFSSMSVSGNSYICNLPNGSKVSDSFIIKPSSVQDINTIYTLYSTNARIEFNADAITNLTLRLSNGILVYTNGGKFQCALIVGDKTYKITGSTDEQAIVSIEWNKTQSTIDIGSTVKVQNLELTIKNKNNVQQLKANGICFGAFCDFLDTTPTMNEYRIARPYLEDLKENP